MFGFVPLVAWSPKTQRYVHVQRNRQITFGKQSRRYAISPKTKPIQAVDDMFLSEENVNVGLDEAKVKLGSIFGNSADNRNVGITGDAELASLDGPIVVLRLKGRFWHKRADVVRYSFL